MVRRLLALALAACVAAGIDLAAQRRVEPIVILVSFDGWRHDYIGRLPATNLQALARRGVRARAMTPSFPTLTFPNHYTMVTGLYPDHHGIVSNNIVDPSFPERFSMSAATARDGRWWLGEPVWATAIRQGKRTASMFWPGEEADIAGVRPTYFVPYDKKMPEADRVRQVLTWLAMPEAQRPSFITLYFEAVDTAGHDFGPASPELHEAARTLDASLGQLVDGLRTLGLENQTTVIVVSDHGMTELSPNRVIYLEDLVDVSTVDVSEWNSLLAMAPKDGDVEALYHRLAGRHPKLKIYRRQDMPARLRYGKNPRVAPIIGLPAEGWAVTTRERLAKKKLDAGSHGADNAAVSMGALFVAAGPGLRKGVVVPPFANVNVYNLICEQLHIEPAPNDGSPSVLKRFLAPRP